MKQRHAVVALAMTPLLVLTACGGSSAGDNGTDGGTKAPVKIGLLAPLTGALAGVGVGYKWGLQVAFDAANAKGGVLDGRKFEVQTVDESPTDTTVSTGAMRKFAADGVKIAVGAALSQDCLAAAPIAEQLKILNISPGCGVGSLIGPDRKSKTFFSAAGTNTMQSSGLVNTLTQKYPDTKSLYTVNYDYVTGREVQGQIRKGFKDKLNVTGQDFFVPLNSVDYGTVVSSLSAKATGDSATQGLILTNYGGGALTFLKQAEQAGLLKKFAFVGTAYQFYAPAVAFKGASPKVWDAYVYVHHAIFDNPVNKSFVESYRKLSGNAYPNDWGFSGYITGLAIVQALEKAKSEDISALNDALEGMTIDGPTGSFQVEASTHHFLMPEVVAQIGGDPAAEEGVKLYDSVIIPGVEANKPL